MQFPRHPNHGKHSEAFSARLRRSPLGRAPLSRASGACRMKPSPAQISRHVDAGVMLGWLRVVACIAIIAAFAPWGVVLAGSTVGPAQTAVVYTPAPPPSVNTPMPTPESTISAAPSPAATPIVAQLPVRAPASEERFDLMFYVAVGCAVLGVVLLIVAIAMPKRRTAKRKRR